MCVHTKTKERKKKRVGKMKITILFAVLTTLFTPLFTYTHYPCIYLTDFPCRSLLCYCMFVVLCDCPVFTINNTTGNTLLILNTHICVYIHMYVTHLASFSINILSNECENIKWYGYYCFTRKMF